MYYLSAIRADKWVSGLRVQHTEHMRYPLEPSIRPAATVKV